METRELADIVEDVFCRCHEDYSDRELVDPGCQAHDFADFIRNPLGWSEEAAALLSEPEKREPDADGLHWLTATMLVSKVLAAHSLGLSEDNEVALISDLVDAVCSGTPSDSPTAIKYPSSAGSAAARPRSASGSATTGRT